MSKELDAMLEESEQEWAELDEKIAAREKKDKKIISRYCAENKPADVINMIELLEKYSGLPEQDEEILKKFREEYPKKLTVKTILNMRDIQDVYQSYLESGGVDDD